MSNNMQTFQRAKLLRLIQVLYDNSYGYDDLSKESGDDHKMLAAHYAELGLPLTKPPLPQKDSDIVLQSPTYDGSGGNVHKDEDQVHTLKPTPAQIEDMTVSIEDELQGGPMEIDSNNEQPDDSDSPTTNDAAARSKLLETQPHASDQDVLNPHVTTSFPNPLDNSIPDTEQPVVTSLLKGSSLTSIKENAKRAAKAAMAARTARGSEDATSSRPLSKAVEMVEDSNPILSPALEETELQHSERDVQIPSDHEVRPQRSPSPHESIVASAPTLEPRLPGLFMTGPTRSNIGSEHGMEERLPDQDMLEANQEPEQYLHDAIEEDEEYAPEDSQSLPIHPGGSMTISAPHLDYATSGEPIETVATSHVEQQHDFVPISALDPTSVRHSATDFVYHAPDTASPFSESQKTSPVRPPLHQSPSYEQFITKQEREIQEMRKKIHLAEMKRRLKEKSRGGGTPTTPQLEQDDRVNRVKEDMVGPDQPQGLDTLLPALGTSTPTLVDNLKSPVTDNVQTEAPIPADELNDTDGFQTRGEPRDQSVPPRPMDISESESSIPREVASQQPPQRTVGYSSPKDVQKSISSDTPPVVLNQSGLPAIESESDVSRLELLRAQMRDLEEKILKSKQTASQSGHKHLLSSANNANTVPKSTEDLDDGQATGNNRTQEHKQSAAPDRDANDAFSPVVQNDDTSGGPKAPESSVTAAQTAILAQPSNVDETDQDQTYVESLAPSSKDSLFDERSSSDGGATTAAPDTHLPSSPSSSGKSDAVSHDSDVDNVELDQPRDPEAIDLTADDEDSAYDPEAGDIVGEGYVSGRSGNEDVSGSRPNQPIVALAGVLDRLIGRPALSENSSSSAMDVEMEDNASTSSSEEGEVHMQSVDVLDSHGESSEGEGSADSETYSPEESYPLLPDEHHMEEFLPRSSSNEGQEEGEDEGDEEEQEEEAYSPPQPEYQIDDDDGSPEETTSYSSLEHENDPSSPYEPPESTIKNTEHRAGEDPNTNFQQNASNALESNLTFTAPQSTNLPGLNEVAPTNGRANAENDSLFESDLESGEMLSEDEEVDNTVSHRDS